MRRLWRPGLLGLRRRLGALVLVAVRPLEQRGDVERLVVDAGVQVADLREPLRHREDGEVVGLAAVDLVPADRRRHPGLGHAPDRVGGGDRVVARVLVVVDEELRGVAVLAPPRRRDLSPGPPLDLACERQRAAAYVLEAVVGRDPHVDVHPRPAAGLGEADGTELVEHLVGDVGDPLHGGPVTLRTRVEVDAPLVGLLGVRAPAVPRVELDRRHLHRPDDAGQLGHAQLVGGALPPREEQLDGLDPLGCSGRQALLVHLVARQALGEAVQHARTLEERVHDPVADGEVVLDEVELGRAARRRVGGREVDAVGVGDLDDAVVDLDLGERRRHVKEPSRKRRSRVRRGERGRAARPRREQRRARGRGRDRAHQTCGRRRASLRPGGLRRLLLGLLLLLPVLLLGLLVAGLRLLRLVHGHGDDVDQPSSAYWLSGRCQRNSVVSATGTTTRATPSREARTGLPTVAH